MDLLISVYEEAVHLKEELKVQRGKLAGTNDTLTDLYHLAEELTRAVSEREVCDTALKYAMQLLGIQTGWISLWQNNTFRMGAVRNLPPVLLGQGAMEGLCECRRRFLARELNPATNILECERLKHAKGDTDGLRYHVSVPLRSGDRMLGIMNLCGASRYLFREDNLKTLYGAVPQIGFALEHTQSRERLENLAGERAAELKLFRTLLDNSNDAIEVLEPVAFKFLDINETACRALGYSREELLTMNVFDIDPAISAESVKMVALQLRESGSVLLETVHRRKDGLTFPVEVSVTSVELDKPYWLAVARDITQRKGQEAKINRLNQIYSVLSSINTTIVRVRERQQLFDQACRIAVEQGKFICTWIGLFDAGTQQITPVASARCNDGICPAGIDLTSTKDMRDEHLLVRVLTQGKPAIYNSTATDKVIQSLHAKALQCGDHSFAVFPLMQRSQLVGIFAFYASEIGVFDTEEVRLLVDMTDNISFALDHLETAAVLRRLNEELEDKVAARTADLEQARFEANRANQAKSMFLSTMSHEIRTPMSGVIGMIDALHQTSLQGHQVEMVDLIRESAFSLLDIIEDILDISKIEAGKLEVERAPMSVVDTVEQSCGLLARLAATKGVELTLFIDPSIPEEVLGDPLRLRQVLVNLTNNAIKFSSGRETAGRVSVRVLLAGHGPDQVTVEFQVTDNGIGMDEQTQARLFTAFAQADTATTRRFGGTGLGLAISGRLVELMGGKITVRSAPGQGATFTVCLPLTPLPAKPIEHGKLVDLTGFSCLVLGDSEGLADDLAVYLTYSGAIVERALNLAAARQLIDTVSPGLWLVIIDAGHDTPPVQELRAACRARLNPDPRFVVVERGRRRKERAQTADIITLDGNAMRRRSFLRAVAIAAGRAREEEETPQPGKIEAIAPPSRDEALQQGRLILIAEDNETNRKVILHQLGLLGYAADVAGDGREALKRWESGNYALLLTDLYMPEMDGYALSQAIRSSEAGKRHIPIVALTANAVKGEAERCSAAGLDDYLSKPARLADLQAMLEKWLARANDSTLSAGPPEEIHGSAAPVLDVRVLKDLVGDDADTVREFLADYRASARHLADEMHAAITAGDARHAGAIAHKLKSSSRSVGALALGDLCDELEKFGRIKDKAAIVQSLAQFDASLAKVETEIARLLAEQ